MKKPRGNVNLHKAIPKKEASASGGSKEGSKEDDKPKKQKKEDKDKPKKIQKEKTEPKVIIRFSSLSAVRG